MAVTAKKPKKKKSVKSNLKPIGDRVVVQRDEVEAQTAGGLYLPENAKDKPSRGIIISVGDGRMLPSGERAPLQVKAGDHVLFTSYGPDEVKIDDNELLLMREDNILAVIG